MTGAITRQRLCRLDDLTDPGARGFTLQTPHGLQDIFLVRRGQAVYAYANHCPHTGSPLDWQPDQFLNLDRTLIQCATHLALFRIDDGHCVAGPCAGQSLTSVAVTLDDGWVIAAPTADCSA
ncbi:MAG: Rieske 2Fe-2S domain-containing protein [Gammaproteobacteria bacterium]|nr:Rieske 2Fe-2S domain-containing protein [Gammaproteobacteria bacterium]